MKFIVRDSKWLRLVAWAFIIDMTTAAIIFVAKPDPEGLPYLFGFFSMFGVMLFGFVGMAG